MASLWNSTFGKQQYIFKFAYPDIGPINKKMFLLRQTEEKCYVKALFQSLNRTPHSRLKNTTKDAIFNSVKPSNHFQRKKYIKTKIGPKFVQQKTLLGAQSSTYGRTLKEYVSSFMFCRIVESYLNCTIFPFFGHRELTELYQSDKKECGNAVTISHKNFLKIIYQYFDL